VTKEVSLPRPLSPTLTETQRDRRTVFCRQLAMRLEPQELRVFCEQAGPVRDVRIVYDRISRRSKGVAYVEFCEEETVPRAVALSGQKLLGIPIVIEITETEKNRLAEEAATAARLVKLQEQLTAAVSNRLQVEGLPPGLGEMEVKQVFDPFGPILSIQLHSGQRGSNMAIVQYRHPKDALQASEHMNGFELVGRRISVTLIEGTFTQPPEKRHPAEEREDDDDDVLDRDEPDIIAEQLKQARESSLLRTMTASTLSCVHLVGMYDPKTEKGSEWHLEVAAEVKDECKKFGRVVEVRVPRTAAGDVFVQFEDVDSAASAAKSLQGRWFGGKQIQAKPITLEEFHHCSP